MKEKYIIRDFHPLVLFYSLGMLPLAPASCSAARGGPAHRGEPDHERLDRPRRPPRHLGASASALRHVVRHGVEQGFALTAGTNRPLARSDGHDHSANDPVLALALLVSSLALAACGGKSAEVSGGVTTEVSGGGVASASCAMLVSYDGHTYLGTAVEATPVPGDSIGNGTIPPCNDTGGAGTTIPAEQVEVTSVQGVPPTVAIMLAGRNDVVLVRDDVKPHDVEEVLPALDRSAAGRGES